MSMTEREGEILRQALIGPGGKTVMLGGMEFTVGFAPPETQSEIAQPDQSGDEGTETLFEELSDWADPRERYIN